MAKKKSKTVDNQELITAQEMAILDVKERTLTVKREEILNTMLYSRERLMRSFLDPPNRDINCDCGYPNVLEIEDYYAMWDREGIAKRVVYILPEGCWSVEPVITEVDDNGLPTNEQGEFAKAIKNMMLNKRLCHYWRRADELSRIGSFGGVLLGIDDGGKLNQPVNGIGEVDDEGKITNTPTSHKLLYVRPFSQRNLTIAAWETDEQNPRFGKPTMYNVQFFNVEDGTESITTAPAEMKERQVHWTRFLHFADNLAESEVLGVPAMKPCYNRLYDLRKVLGASAEMLWKGGFPGYAFETNPDIMNPETDEESIRKEFEDYMNTLQRFIAVQGVTVKSLAVQVASPVDHFNVLVNAIAITIGVPLRIFMGSEQAKLASTQDKEAWSERLLTRQFTYLTPQMVRPTIDRFMLLGLLPVVERYSVEWPDLYTLSDESKADVAGKVVNAMAKAVTGNVDQLMTPEDMLVEIFYYTPERAKQLMENVKKRIEEEATFHDAMKPPAPIGGPNGLGPPGVQRDGTGKGPIKDPQVKNPRIRDIPKVPTKRASS